MASREAWYREQQHRTRWGDPMDRPARAEIIRRGRIVATVYPRKGEALDELESRAQRLSRAYSGKVIFHAS